MKKALSIILAVSLLLTALVIMPLTANANEKEIAVTGAKSGTTGDCTWTLDDSGVLSISGTGEMADYSFDQPWGTSITEVIITNGVTSIGSSAFSNCSSLTSVTIPDSVTRIGNFAFFYCSSLSSVIIPDSVTSIGGSAFWECSSLTSVTIPDSVTSIGGNAFYGCRSLTSVIIPDSVTSIGGYAFYECTELTSVTIGDSVEDIGTNAFYGCKSLKSVTIPSSVTDIYEKAFGYYYKDGLGGTKVKNFTIYGYAGSEAERYANDNKFAFVALDEEPLDPTATTKRELFGDVDGDGEVGVIDATYIQRYAAKIETPYPIGEKIE